LYVQASWLSTRTKTQNCNYQVISISCRTYLTVDQSNDALRKHGIIPALEPSPPTPPRPPSPTLDDLLAEFTPKELEELGDDARDDEMERVISAYRKQRIEEERREERRGRFGRVYPIGREDYTREVTEASLFDEDGDDEEKGTGVVCLLYKDG
jgi:hypothetical protein